MAERKTIVLCARAEDALSSPVGRALVVGCGDGHEAVVVADHFDAEVVGIDLAGDFDPAAAERADLRVMDATDLAFGDDTFDLVYSFHALEHIDDPERALQEMRRVLKPKGVYCIGTPNRRRIIGYIGSTTDLATKIRWNLNDLQMRLRGRWRNELGAHAGFTSEELGEACERAFGEATEITDDYYRHLYPSGRVGAVVARLAGTWPARYLFPCVYFRGRCLNERVDRASARTSD